MATALPGAAGQHCQDLTLLSSPLPSGFGPLPLGGGGHCSLASPGVQAQGDGQGPSASSSQACSQVGTLGAHCALERPGFLGERRLSVPGGGCSLGLPPLPSLPGLQRGLELTSSARTPLQLCKTLHESLPVLNTRLCPGCGEGVDAPDGPAAVLVRRRQLSGPGAGRAGPWGEAASGRGCPGICPLPGSQGCPGEAPGHGGVQQEENLVSAEQLGPALWSSRWRKPRSCLFQRPWMGLPRPAVPLPSSCPPATARAAARLRGVTSSPAALWPPWT